MNRVADSSDKSKNDTAGGRTKGNDPFVFRFGDENSLFSNERHRYSSTDTSINRANSTRIPVTSTSHISTLVGFGSAKSGPRKCLTVDTFLYRFLLPMKIPGDRGGMAETVVTVDKDKMRKKNGSKAFAYLILPKETERSAQTKYLSGS